MSITGLRLKERRKSIEMSADEVASELGVSRSTIFRYENGYIEKVPANVIEELAVILKTTPAYLMGWTDDPNNWAQIGNDEGIYPPKDYEGNYEDYVKYKYMEDSDNLIDSYYDTCDNAINYLRSLGCHVADIEGTNDILVIAPNNEHIRVNEGDLVYNFMIFGASKPGIKKLVAPRRIADLRDDEDQLLNSYNSLNDNGRAEAKKRIDELTMIPVYTNKNKVEQLPQEDKPHLNPIAAHNDFADDPEQQSLMNEDIEDMKNNW